MMIRKCLLVYVFLYAQTLSATVPFAFWKATPAPTGGCASGGFLYNGSCYYLGVAGDSCITTCASLGGCLLDPTKTVGLDATKCASLLTSLGKSPGSSVSGFSNYYYACSINGTTYTYEYMTVTCGASASNQQRVCSCGSGGLSQSGVNTVDGYNYRLGASGASCDTTCASYGGCVAAGVTNANTSATKCNQMMAAMDISTTGTSSGTSTAGCGFQTTGYRYRGSGVADCSGSVTGVQRVCACTNP